MSANLRLVQPETPPEEGLAGYIGHGTIYGIESSSRKGKAYLVVNIGGWWNCACQAETECRHVRRAKRIKEGMGE